MTDVPKKSNQPSKREEPFGELIKSMNEFFHDRPFKGLLGSIDDFFRTPFPGASISVQVKETESDYIVKAELPGIKKEQISIDIIDNYITITANQHNTLIEEDERQHRFQRQDSYQRLSRTITLPQRINEKKVKASYKDGLLIIKVKKERGKQITILDS